MRAALLEQPSSALNVVDDVELEEPRPGEVLVRIAFAGVCHSDLSVIEGRIPSPYPVVLGHEVSGYIESVGPGVPGLAEGMKVVLTARPPCRICYWCVRGEVQLCEAGTAMLGGTYADGGTRMSRGGEVVYRGIVLAGFAERTVVPASSVIPIPDDSDMATASIVGCAVSTGVGAVLRTAKVEPGATVIVVGLGGVGISIVQGARIAGASRIIAIDPVEARRDQAIAFGATDVAAPDDGPAHGIAKQLTAGVGVDYAFDAVGRAAIAESLLKGVRRGGTCVLVGLPGPDETIPVPGLTVNLNEKKLMGCYMGSVDPARDYRVLLDLHKRGHLDLDAMVTDRRPLGEINEAFADMRSGAGIRTVLAI